jgi:hypothetical protein
MNAPAPPCRPKPIRRGNPEADIQRQIVRALRLVLPPGGIVHHSAHEVRRGGAAGHLAQAVAVGMGVHPGFSDLIVLSEGRVIFLEVKAPAGRLSESQRIFADRVKAQGHGWALVRSVEDAFSALREAGFRTQIRRAI